MLKSLLITCLFSFIVQTAAFAQNLKVSAVDASEDKIYNEVAPKYLGKTMMVAIYDNSATVKFAGMDQITLKVASENNYSKVERENDNESHTFYLKLEKTVGVLISATLKYVIQEKGGKQRTAYFIITAKRF